jgi:hypothetical protein
MKHVKVLVLLIALFPTTTFANGSNRESKPQDATYDSELAKLEADSNQLTLAMLNRGTSTGTSRGPASNDFKVTLVKRTK